MSPSRKSQLEDLPAIDCPAAPDNKDLTIRLVALLEPVPDCGDCGLVELKLVDALGTASFLSLKLKGMKMEAVSSDYVYSTIQFVR